MLTAPIRVLLPAPLMKFGTELGHSKADTGGPLAHGENLTPEERRKRIVANTLGSVAFCYGCDIDMEKVIFNTWGAQIGQNVFTRVAPNKYSGWPPDWYGTLIIRDYDTPNRKIVLITGYAPHYVIKGWLDPVRGREIGEEKPEEGRKPAYFILGTPANIYTDMTDVLDECPKKKLKPKPRLGQLDLFPPP